MANPGYIKGLLGFLPSDSRRVFGVIFDYLLGNLRVGLPGHQKRAENLAWVQLDGTTPAVADTEFSIEHGIETAPRVLFPCVDLTTVGAKLIPLSVTRAADNRRVYLSNSSTSAAFTVFVEQR